jgi:hypothetical protein
LQGQGGDFDSLSTKVLARVHPVDDKRNLERMSGPRKKFRKLPASLALFTLALSVTAFSQTPAPDPKAVPVLDGAAGPCSADFTITDNAGTPVYAAKISVHIAYRFGSFHKLDLELSTNVDGKARFTGLPDRVKRGMTFHASEGDRAGEAFDDPATTCKAQLTIALQKKTQ